MILRDIIDADLQSIQDDLDGPVITWKGEEYECIPSTNAAVLELSVGGLAADLDISFTIRKSLFTDEVYPVSKETIEYNDQRYRIEFVRSEMSGAIIRLLCTQINRGV